MCKEKNYGGAIVDLMGKDAPIVMRVWHNGEAFRTAEVFEKNKTMFFTSIFCGSLFCISAVYIFNNLIADS
jgi:hypothetical protein